MNTERIRANQRGYPYPVNPTIEATHDSFNRGAARMVQAVLSQGAGVVIASHNEDSMALMAQEVVKQGLKPDERLVDFATLYGMSDHASLALAQRGYNVCKYIPFGPVHDVLPYLLRRMQENRGFIGRTADERGLMWEEIVRRVK